MNKDSKKRIDNMTDLIVSCWDENQPQDSKGKPLDGLTFDERLTLKMKELKGQDKVLMNEILRGV